MEREEREDRERVAEARRLLPVISQSSLSLLCTLCGEECNLQQSDRRRLLASISKIPNWIFAPIVADHFTAAQPGSPGINVNSKQVNKNGLGISEQLLLCLDSKLHLLGQEKLAIISRFC